MAQTKAKQVGTIDIRPSPEGYARTLLLIVLKSTSATDRKWAEEQIIAAFKQCAEANPKEWGKS